MKIEWDYANFHHSILKKKIRQNKKKKKRIKKRRELGNLFIIFIIWHYTTSSTRTQLTILFYFNPEIEALYCYTLNTIYKYSETTDYQIKQIWRIISLSLFEFILKRNLPAYWEIWKHKKMAFHLLFLSFNTFSFFYFIFFYFLFFSL